MGFRTWKWALSAATLVVAMGCSAEVVSEAEVVDQALTYGNGASQFGGGFAPSNAPYGGFGGGYCATTRTPVIFVHGNGDVAEAWDYPPATAPTGVYDSFKAAGYNDCELFGINWLSSSEVDLPQLNYHDAGNRDMIADFIVDVLDYTGASQVDVVAHSMGVTVSLEAVQYYDLYPEVRRFVGIGGAMRGLTSCYSVGYANAAATTCGSENWWTSSIFGFYPDVLWYAPNDRMGNGGFRDYPAGEPTQFYTISAGDNDQILCSAVGNGYGCQTSALFDSRTNVLAQLDIGYGSTTVSEPLSGGDADGVGHFRSRNNSGPILLNMLTTSCSGTGCCSGYSDPCVTAH